MNSVLLGFFWSPSSANRTITPHSAGFMMLLVLAFLIGYSKLVLALTLSTDFLPYSICNILLTLSSTEKVWETEPYPVAGTTTGMHI
jgi:hypothetical protein